MSSLASGWSFLSSSATKIASKATENAVKYGGLATQKVVDISSHVGDKVKEGSLLEDVGTQITSLTNKVMQQESHQIIARLTFPQLKTKKYVV
jgi:ADP-ribosylation factor GTPase-activating protein 1